MLVPAILAVSNTVRPLAKAFEMNVERSSEILCELRDPGRVASGTIAAILLIGAVSLAALRHGVLPRWLGWAGFPAAALLPLAVSFVGFLVLALWVLAVSVALAFRRRSAEAHRPVVQLPADR